MKYVLVNVIIIHCTNGVCGVCVINKLYIITPMLYEKFMQKK